MEDGVCHSYQVHSNLVSPFVTSSGRALVFRQIHLASFVDTGIFQGAWLFLSTWSGLVSHAPGGGEGGASLMYGLL